MRFKQQEEKEDNKLNALYPSFTKILQIEEDKMSLVEAAISYFYMNGNIQYKKFFKYLHKACMKCKMEVLNFLYDNFGKTPERMVHSLKLEDISEDIKIFELLASAEDEFTDEIEKAINIANENKQWQALAYLMDMLKGIDHLCCRAVAAVKSGSNLLDLIPCEQHSSEK